MTLRASEKSKFDAGDVLLGDVTTLNLTIFRAGVQHNVVPAEAECGFDIRLPPSVDLDNFRSILDHWAAETVGFNGHSDHPRRPPSSNIPRLYLPTYGLLPLGSDLRVFGAHASESCDGTIRSEPVLENVQTVLRRAVGASSLECGLVCDPCIAVIFPCTFLGCG